MQCHLFLKPLGKNSGEAKYTNKCMIKKNNNIGKDYIQLNCETMFKNVFPIH